MENNTEVIKDAEMVEPGALMQIEKAQIDMQIATAHQYPRSMQQFKDRAIAIATLDEDTAASCIYRRPVGQKPDGSMEFAEGMSVRTAEIVGASYGNLIVGARIIEQDERHVVAQGVAHDLESNFRSTSEVIESTVTRKGKPFSERMRITVAKAALAKARRDATFQVVPKALCKPIEKAVREVLTGDQKTLDTRRKMAETWVGKLDIDAKRVWAALGINGSADMTAEHLETLTGLKTAIKDGDIKIDDAFPRAETSPIESGELLGGKKEEPPAENAADPKPEDEKPEPEVSPAQHTDDDGIIDYAKLDKRACLAGVDNHKGEPWFAPILDDELGQGADPKGFAVSVLREVLRKLNEAQEAAG